MWNGLRLKRDVSFLEIIEGETEVAQRATCESGLFALVDQSGIPLSSVEINVAGCFVSIASSDVAAFRLAARQFNVAVRVHDHCGCVVLPHVNYTRCPSLPALIAGITKEGVAIVHVSVGESETSIAVDSGQLHAAAAIVDRICKANQRRTAA